MDEASQILATADRGGKVDKTLASAALFEAVQPHARAAVRKQLHPVSFLPRRTVFAGEPGDRLYIIKSGEVKIGRSYPDGREHLLTILGPGDMFGELAVFDPGPRDSSLWLIKAKRFARTPPNVSGRQPRYRHGALRRRPGLVAKPAAGQDGSATMYEQPYRHYWRVLYPEYADPKSTAHWYPKWKTAEMCIGVFDERQQARHKWIADGPRRGREKAHATAVVTYHASPVRSLTVKVCLSCLWISKNLNEGHPESGE